MNKRQEELDRNIVADNLFGAYKKIEPYSKLILAGVVAIAVLLVAIGLYTSGQSQNRSQATWELLMENPEVTSRFPSTAAASWSLLFRGNEDLAQGINQMYQDREAAETQLSQAKDLFNDAIDLSDDTLVISRAYYGIGLAEESLGNVDDAVEAYQGVVKANESEQMVEVAQERIDRLSEPETEEFLAWFADQDFSPADPSLPPELPGSSTLPDLPDLELPDLELPDLDMDDKMKAGDQPATGGMTLPSSEETTPEETTPEETQSGDAKTEEAKPAETTEKPPAETDQS